MTPERAKELLPIVQAFADGKQVEWRNPKCPDGEWHPYLGGIRFDDEHVLWRVKSELREWWICPKCQLATQVNVQDCHCGRCTRPYIHVREVLP